MHDHTKGRLNETALQVTALASQIRRETDEVMAQGTHIDMVRHFKDMRDANAVIKEARKALEEIEDFLSMKAIPDAFKAAGVKTVTIEGVGRTTVSYRFSCSMLDKEQGMGWLRDNGHEGLIQPTVNSSSLAAFAKDMLENHGTELPIEIFKTSMNPYTSITKVS